MAAGAGGALLGAWLAARAARQLLRVALRTARWWLLALTLRLYRPCPDCHQYIHADARLCHRCGYRKRP